MRSRPLSRTQQRPPPPQRPFFLLAGPFERGCRALTPLRWGRRCSGLCRRRTLCDFSLHLRARRRRPLFKGLRGRRRGRGGDLRRRVVGRRGRRRPGRRLWPRLRLCRHGPCWRHRRLRRRALGINRREGHRVGARARKLGGRGGRRQACGPRNLRKLIELPSTTESYGLGIMVSHDESLE